jgi:hypothetical protein
VTLPANFTSGESFTAADENAVESAVNALQAEFPVNLASNVTGVLPTANGGTGTATDPFPINLASNVTGTLGTAHGGTGSTATAFVNLASNVTGVLPVTNGGTGVSVGAETITTGATAASTTQTQLASLSIPASTLVAGSTFAFKIIGNGSAGSMTFEIHIGTTNTTSDAIALTIPATGSGGAFMADGALTVRTTGSSGTCIANGFVMGLNTLQGSTGTATTTVNTTVANFITISAASSSGTFTAQVAYIYPIT